MPGGQLSVAVLFDPKTKHLKELKMHHDHSVSSDVLSSTLVGAVICILLLLGGLWFARFLARRRETNSKRVKQRKGKLVGKGHR